MASKVQKTCRICGKLFTPCADCENDKTMFRWKKIACSLECAKEYFARIEASRKLRIKHIASQPVEMENSETTDTISEVTITTENIISKRTRKKNIENKESEQID